MRLPADERPRSFRRAGVRFREPCSRSRRFWMESARNYENDRFREAQYMSRESGPGFWTFGHRIYPMSHKDMLQLCEFERAGSWFPDLLVGLSRCADPPRSLCSQHGPLSHAFRQQFSHRNRPRRGRPRPPLGTLQYNAWRTDAAIATAHALARRTPAPRHRHHHGRFMAPTLSLWAVRRTPPYSFVLAQSWRSSSGQAL